MKKISDMQMEEYGKTAEEIMVAGAMKLYIQSIEPKEALRKVRAVYEPKVIRLDRAKRCQCKALLMVQSTRLSLMRR